MSKPSPAEVRDRVSKIEADWMRTIDGEVSSRKLDEKVRRGLDRMEARKRARAAAPPKIKPVADKRRGTMVVEKMAAAEGFSVGPAKKPITFEAPPPAPCNWCGLCRRCKREARMRQILNDGKTMPALHPLAMDLLKLAARAEARLGEFSGKPKADRDRIVTRRVEDICDRADAIYRVGWWTK